MKSAAESYLWCGRRRTWCWAGRCRARAACTGTCTPFPTCSSSPGRNGALPQRTSASTRVLYRSVAHLPYCTRQGHRSCVSIPNGTSCARGDTMCPLQVDNIFALIRQVAAPFRHDNIFVFVRQVAPVPACWLFEDISNKLTFDLLTLKVVSESRVTWATSVPILVFVSEMTYTVSSGTLNSSIPYHT